MTKIKNNPIMKGASGMLGKTVVYRETKNGTLIMANKPRKSGSPTDQQLMTMLRFEEGAQYAKSQISDPITKAEYAAAGASKGRSAYQAAMTDFLSKPRLIECNTDGYTGVVGNFIDIRAIDDFKLVSVQVKIANAAGTVLEQGTAILQAQTAHYYRYTITVANANRVGTKVTVTLRDKPGNVVVTTKVL
jgi:hypothetical protein